MINKIKTVLFILIITVSLGSILTLAKTNSDWNTKKAITDVYLVEHNGQGFDEQVKELNTIVDENISSSIRIAFILILTFIVLFIFYHITNRIIFNRFSKNKT